MGATDLTRARINAHLDSLEALSKQNEEIARGLLEALRAAVTEIRPELTLIHGGEDDA